MSDATPRRPKGRLVWAGPDRKRRKQRCRWVEYGRTLYRHRWTDAVKVLDDGMEPGDNWIATYEGIE